MAAHFHRVSGCFLLSRRKNDLSEQRSRGFKESSRAEALGIRTANPFAAMEVCPVVFICFHMFSLYFRMNFTVISCQSPRSEQVPFGPRQFVKSNRRRFPWRSLERCRQLIRGIVFCCDVRCGDSIYAAKWFEGRLHLGNGSIPSRRGGWEKPCGTHSTRFCKVSGLDTLFGAKPCKTKLSHKIIFGFLRPIVRYFCYEVNKSIK